MKLGPCRLLSALFANESEERLRFPEEIDIIRSNSVPQPVVSIQSVDNEDVFEMFENHRGTN